MDAIAREAIDDVLGRALERMKRVQASLTANSAAQHELAVACRLVESVLNMSRAEQAAALDGDATHHPSPDLPAPMQPLTAREEEVLQLMARGLRNREIAQVLSVSERTAIFHVGNVIAKLGADSRAEAVHRARQRKLLIA